MKQVFREVEDQELINLIGGYMKFLDPPEGFDTMELSADEAKQTGLLAAQALSRQLYERVKNA